MIQPAPKRGFKGRRTSPCTNPPDVLLRATVPIYIIRRFWIDECAASHSANKQTNKEFLLLIVQHQKGRAEVAHTHTHRDHRNVETHTQLKSLITFLFSKQLQTIIKIFFILSLWRYTDIWTFMIPQDSLAMMLPFHNKWWFDLWPL